ncbi:MAG: phospho-N-acetylmuramoyl-pentapeptide-transferase [Candidatus Neomarinimicrobiota bacterium]|nr:MAG: phospho-N-acetylmuramoyl-pentapeptide-transferase [Candidatus Neomarinimicrobiota bacterium]
MIYLFLYPLKKYVTWLNVLGYISFRSTAAALTALFIAFILGPYLIRVLKKHNIGETIRQNGPTSHLQKSGTPTMGGLLIHVSVIIPVLLWGDITNHYIQILLITLVWTGLLGFIDDYLKVYKKLKKGLIARYKLTGQLLLGLTIGSYLYFFSENPEISSAITIPFLKDIIIPLGIFYILFVTLVITGSSNAVNLTDGLDGLATGLLGITTMVFAAISYITGRVDFSSYLHILYIPGAGEITIFLAAMLGGFVGFLWYNAKPAEIFMGDTGSLTYGALIGTIAVLLKQELLLFLVGGVFVIEAISVIIQVTFFKYTAKKYGVGRRIFRMAPLHHHFELKGWDESKVVIRFWILGIMFALMSLVTFKIR